MGGRHWSASESPHTLCSGWIQALLGTADAREGEDYGTTRIGLGIDERLSVVSLLLRKAPDGMHLMCSSKGC
jgi:hypothetical protein